MSGAAAPTTAACDFTPGCSRSLSHPGHCCVPVEASLTLTDLRARHQPTQLAPADADGSAMRGHETSTDASVHPQGESKPVPPLAASSPAPAAPAVSAPAAQRAVAPPSSAVDGEATSRQHGQQAKRPPEAQPDGPERTSRRKAAVSEDESGAAEPPLTVKQAAEAPVKKKRGRPPKLKAPVPLDSSAEAARVDGLPCRWPGCTRKEGHYELCNFADSQGSEGPQRRKRAASAASSALGGSSARGSGSDAATITAPHKLARRVGQAAVATGSGAALALAGCTAAPPASSSSVAPSTARSPLPTHSAAPPVASITPNSQTAEVTSVASEPLRPFPPAQSSSTTALGQLQSQDEVQISEDPSLLHPGLQGISCLSADEMRATLSSLGVRPKKRKAEMGRQLRELLQSTSAADAGLASSSATADTSEESEHVRLCRVLADRLTQGRDVDGNMYFIEDDEEEPWTDECDGCRKVHIYIYICAYIYI